MTTEQNGPTNVQDDIDVALKMLGETQAPAAIVSRVHRSLETAAISQLASSGKNLWIPAAGMATAAFALVVMFTHMHQRPEAQTSSETAKLVATVPLKPATAVPPVARVATTTFEAGDRSVQQPAVRRVRRDHREYRHAANLLSYPLTRQEKLLLQFARNAKPADLQALNPEYQAKVEAQQEAEFAAYLKSGSSSSMKETAN